MRTLTTCALFAVIGIVVTAQSKPPRTPRDQAIEFCRAQSLAHLKFTSTVKWLDLAKEEKGGTWLVSGIRTAKGSPGNVDQQFTCRVQLVNGKPRLKLLQLFKESTKSGKDVFLSP
jgi:hypothetical protein